jgi:hypothetical protein
MNRLNEREIRELRWWCDREGTCQFCMKRRLPVREVVRALRGLAVNDPDAIRRALAPTRAIQVPPFTSPKPA